MASKKPFFTDKMSVNQIINLGTDILNKLSFRDLSHAVRTIALAANKRINRLKQYAYKRKGKWIEKKKSPGIDLNALNKLEGGMFKVGSKDRNEIYKEFSRARNFLNAPSSTIKGAKELRKSRERALFGATREELTKGMTKREKEKFISNMREVSSETFADYEDFLTEYEMQGGYTVEKGRRALSTIAQEKLSGKTPEQAKESAAEMLEGQYKTEMEKEPDFWEELEGSKEWWEEF